MKVFVLLADRGTPNPQGGTLNLLGVGWSTTTLTAGAIPVPITPPHVVVVFFEADLSECNRPVPVELSLVNEDGLQVELPGPAGLQAMRIVQEINVGSPPGLPTGTPGRANLMVDIMPGLPLVPGGYAWRVKVDGDGREEWRAGFRVVGQPQPPAFG